MTSLSKEKAAASEGALGCVLFLLIYPISFIVTGVVVVALWKWFVLPIAPGAPQLNAPQVIGLVSLYQVVRGCRPSEKKDETLLQISGRIFGQCVLYDLFALFAGYIAMRCL